jgi:hypothetical protein
MILCTSTYNTYIMTDNLQIHAIISLDQLGQHMKSAYLTAIRIIQPLAKRESNAESSAPDPAAPGVLGIVSDSRS